MNVKDHFIGVWTIVSNEHISAGGKRFSPFGDKPLGTLIYTAEDTMSVMICARDRKNFLTDRPFEASAEEKISATEKFLAYSGRFEIIGNEVLHHVEISFFPNWVGTIQRRFWKLDGSNLILSTPSFIYNNEEQTAQIVWRRK